MTTTTRGKAGGIADIAMVLLMLAAFGVIGTRMISGAAKTPATVASASQGTVKDEQSAGDRALRVEYTETGKYPQVKAMLMKSRILEYGANSLDAALKLKPLVIQAKECGQVNAYFQTAGISPVKGEIVTSEAIVVCYELINDHIRRFLSLAKDAKTANQFALYATLFGFFHEAGHAVIKQYSIPYTGSQEDAADEFAVVFSVNQVGSGDLLVKTAALRNRMDSGTVLDAATDGWEHRIGMQRSNFYLCRLYGSNLERYKALGIKSGFTPDRLNMCTEKYQQALATWNYFLKDHKR